MAVALIRLYDQEHIFCEDENVACNTVRWYPNR
jgi:hypothetical protein